MAAFLRNGWPEWSDYATTYQSGPAVSLASRKAKFTFDLGILDEAHKTVGEKGALFGHLLDNRNIRIGRRIFMTATERRYRGESDRIASMDDPSLYGETFDQLSFRKAIETQPPILSDYRIITVVVTREEIADLVRKNLLVKPDRGKWNREVEAATLAAALALRRAMQRYPIRHAVSFHANVARAQAFRDCQEALTLAFPKFGGLKVFHVSGVTPTAVRSREIDAFAAARRALVTNARCLTEGVDVPGIDGVLFADPRRSTVDIVQAVGRALRIAPGKTMGYVVVPVLLDKRGTPEHAAQGAAFSDILTVLRALAANDDRIVEYFRAVSQGRRWSQGKTPVQIDLPLGTRIDAAMFAESIELRCWDRLAKLSWRPFEEARKWARSLGLKSVGEWYALCKSGKLPKDIPAAPQYLYRELGWEGMGDWLGTGTVASHLREYRSFSKARWWARSLGLQSVAEWRAFSKSGRLPKDVPANPEGTFAERGWRSWGDWLGTGAVAPRLRMYRSFPRARKWARSLGLESVGEWYAFCKSGKLPKDIPAVPHNTYRKRGWKGMGDWLGTGIVATNIREYRPFSRARSWARSLGLKSGADWHAFCKSGKLPRDIPVAVSKIYSEHWKGMGDWLGTGTVAPRLKVYRSFSRARSWARSLGLKSGADWRAFCKSGKLPKDIPAKPIRTYAKHGWKGIGDWLGTGTVATRLRKYRSFSAARSWARSLGLKSWADWRAFCKSGKLPKDIPANPIRTYAKHGWKGIGDWLGTGTVAPRLKVYRSFSRARSWARSLGLKSGADWRAFCKSGKLPKDIPAAANRIYASQGWKGIGDWLGTGTVATHLRRYRSFSKARSWARSLNLKSQIEWRAFCKSGKLPKDVPAAPNLVYAVRGWRGIGDWLGTGKVATTLRQYRSFSRARSWARSLGLKSGADWRAFCKSGKLPRDIPAKPYRTYAQRGWKGMGDWLGKGRE